MRVSAAPHSQDGVIANIPYYALGSAFASLMEERPLKERPEIAEKREALKPGSSERLDSIFLRYLEGHPASKKELVSLHNLRENVVIDTSEAVQCISDVLIGLQMGFLSGMDAQKLYALEEHIRPAMLTGAPQDRDKKRAEILREATKPIQFN